MYYDSNLEFQPAWKIIIQYQQMTADLFFSITNEKLTVRLLVLTLTTHKLCLDRNRAFEYKAHKTNLPKTCIYLNLRYFGHMAILYFFFFLKAPYFTKFKYKASLIF